MFNALNCLFEDEFTVYKDEWVDDSFTQETEVGTVIGDLQQLDAVRAQENDLEFRKAYVFTTNSSMELKEGYSLKRGDEKYTIKGIKVAQHRKSSLDHKSVILSS